MAACLALVGCPPTEQTHRATFFAFGTLVELTVRSANPEHARQAEAYVAAELDRLHDALTPYTDDSPLSITNRRLVAGESHAPEPVLLALVELSLPHYRSSGGLFNPALGGLVRLWGFHEEGGGALPSAEHLQPYIEKPPSMEQLVLNEAVISSTNPALQLDFGGIAKGYALKVLVDNLAHMGFKHLILNAGGDLRALGRHGTRPWCVGIRHPRKPGETLASLQIRNDESVFTSGDYERYFMYEGRRYHHILDPRSAYPAVDAISVTVVHSDAILADAAATALFIAGPREWRHVAAAMGVTEVLLMDAEGQLHTTEAMHLRMHRGVCEAEFNAPAAEGNG